MITGTQLNYLMVCHRKLWLFSNGIQMEQNSELVEMGKLIHETTYADRPERFQELEIGPVKIDFYDKRNKVIHEIKKSDKLEDSHIWQVKYYIWLMELAGVEGVKGILEYPKLRHTQEVLLTGQDRVALGAMVIEIEKIVASEHCPPRVKTGKCKNCSYFDFCFAGEE
ncbi:MAG: CRISPR-associated protein Cas4 [Mariniphaga sp.]